MIRRMARIYGALLRAALGEALQYRAQALFWLVSAVFPLVMMVVWLAVEQEVGPALGWSASDFISYYVAAAMVQRLTVCWALWNWEGEIRDGTLSLKLLRPIDPVHHLVADQLGWKLIDVTVVVPLVVLATWLSPQITYPVGPGMFAAAVASIIAGLALNLVMQCAFAMIAFWTTQSGNVYGLVNGVGQFLAGYIAPLALFPEPFRQAATLLPFRSMVGLPVEILMGRLGWVEIGFGFAVTCAWFIVFLLLYRTLWRIGLRRYEAVGA